MAKAEAERPKGGFNSKSAASAARVAHGNLTKAERTARAKRLAAIRWAPKQAS